SRMRSPGWTSRYSSTTRTRRAAAMSASLRSIRSSFGRSGGIGRSGGGSRGAATAVSTQPLQQRLVLADALLQVENVVDLGGGTNVPVPVLQDLQDSARQAGGVPRRDQQSHAGDLHD